MNKLNKIIWGVVLIAVGVLFALRALDIIAFDIFFEGWWTLIIIIPCAVGLVTDRDKTGNLIGLIIGVLLLLGARGILKFAVLWKIAVPAIIVIIGVKMIFGAFRGDKGFKISAEIKSSGNFKEVSAVFSGNNVNFNGEVFEGVELNAVFGGVKCDLRGAIIEKDCVIEANAVFGGIDIYLPENVNVKINSSSVFGGISDKRGAAKIENAPTVYINGTCMFGGADVK